MLQKGVIKDTRAIPLRNVCAPQEGGKQMPTNNKPKTIKQIRAIYSIIIAYLDDLLLIGKTKEEAMEARDSVIYLLTNLGFTINWEKSVMEPTQKIEFLGMILDSREMTISLPRGNILNLTSLCQDVCLIQEPHSLRDLASLVWKLCATLPAVSAAPLQLRCLEQDLIRAQGKGWNYESKIFLSPDAKSELRWWIKPLHLGNPEIVIYSDASSALGWGAAMERGLLNRRCVDPSRKDHFPHKRVGITGGRDSHQNIPERPEGIHPTYLHGQHDSPIILDQKGGTKSLTLLKITKRIWDFLLTSGAKITASWIPSHLNK